MQCALRSDSHPWSPGPLKLAFQMLDLTPIYLSSLAFNHPLPSTNTSYECTQAIATFLCFMCMLKFCHYCFKWNCNLKLISVLYSNLVVAVYANIRSPHDNGHMHVKVQNTCVHVQQITITKTLWSDLDTSAINKTIYHNDHACMVHFIVMHVEWVPSSVGDN